MTWAGERSEHFCSFQSPEMFFLLTLPFIEPAYEEHDRGQGPHQPILPWPPVLEFSGIVVDRQNPGEQAEDEEPGIVQVYDDAKDPSQWNCVSKHLSPRNLRSMISSRANTL